LNKFVIVYVKKGGYKMQSICENGKKIVKNTIVYFKLFETTFNINDGSLSISIDSKNDIFYVILNRNENARRSSFRNLEDAINFYSNIIKEISSDLILAEKDINQIINKIQFDHLW
jgi:hypothetical protein